jgi:hypothetical protein
MTIVHDDLTGLDLLPGVNRVRVLLPSGLVSTRLATKARGRWLDCEGTELAADGVLEAKPASSDEQADFWECVQANEVLRELL